MLHPTRPTTTPRSSPARPASASGCHPSPLFLALTRVLTSPSATPPLPATSSKTFASQATHDAHVKTKKHQDVVFKVASKLKAADLSPAPPAAAAGNNGDASMEAPASPVPSTSTAPPPAPTSTSADQGAVFESSGDAALDRLVAKRLQYAPPIPPSACLFCPHASSSAQDNVSHMRAAHSFVIPEEEYLVDLEGLLRRLGEEVGTWNVCVCCGKGYGGNIDLNKESDLAADELKKRASKGVEAVRAHMQSKVRLSRARFSR